MTSENYEDEVVISEFTLSLLEDSGWFKTNYYTGGLLRFGKNKGCSFLTDYCISYYYDYSLNFGYYATPFKDEFFDTKNNFYPSCTTGRLSRTYNLLNIYDQLDNPAYYQLLPKYNENQYSGGALFSADYCPVNFHLIPEYTESYFVGNCKLGNGNYGTNLYYVNAEGKTENNHPNSELSEELGEKYSDNSFCMMSSLVPNGKFEMYGTIFHPMCFPSFCSSSSLTILIYDQYIVCPRQGGNVQVNGYSGLLHCPDYNLICTGTVMCNNLFDCIDKKSESKDNTYSYDYERLTTQDYTGISSVKTLIGAELAEDGVCPQFCVQCTENKKCKQCSDTYNLIGEKENDDQPIICDNKIDISKGYYLKDNVYYRCHDNCEKCSDGPVSDEKMNCIECKKGFKFNEETTNCEKEEEQYEHEEEEEVYREEEEKKENIEEEEENGNNNNNEKDGGKNDNSLTFIIIVSIAALVIIIAILVIIICIKKKKLNNENIDRVSKEEGDIPLYDK